MKRILIAAASAFIAKAAFAQCQETVTTRAMMIGDSWAVFMLADNTFNDALTKWGHTDKANFSNLVLSENGTRTTHFLGNEKQAEIAAQLAANPDVEVVHVSIGGNDVLNAWDIDYTPQMTDSLETAVRVRLTAIIEYIKSLRPGIRIVWSGYAYPNFGEVIGVLPTFTQNTHPFMSTWNGMGRPTFPQINNLLVTFSASVAEYAATDPQVDFVPCPGILQHHFGQPQPLGVAPGGSYPAFEAPLPNGYPDYPSPAVTMRDYFFFKDCFHLSAAGYNVFIDHQFQKFYHKFFMGDQYLLAGGGNASGSVSSSGAVDASPMLGESGGDTYATVLSFDTPAMLDSVVVRASIFLRRQTQVGGSPYTGPIEVRVADAFGPSAVIEPEDFGDQGLVASDVCVFGSNGGDGHWVRLDLPESLLPYITRDHGTQFLISAPEASGGLVVFHDASDPDFAPVLDLDFLNKPTEPSAVSAQERASLRIFPNPASDAVHVRTEARILSLEAYDMLGQRVSVGNPSSATIGLGHVPPGIYSIVATTDAGSATQRVIRK